MNKTNGEKSTERNRARWQRIPPERRKEMMSALGAKANEARHQRARDYANRFWNSVEKCVGDGCWVWTGRLARKGYGDFYCLGRHRFAHRVAWELTHGAIADGLWVLHHCDNPRCVRPDHLFLGTVGDNVRDAVGKGRWGDQHGEDNAQAKLTDEQARCIYQQLYDGTPGVDLARDYAVSEKTISDIKHGKHYGRATQQLRKERR